MLLHSGHSLDNNDIAPLRLRQRPHFEGREIERVRMAHMATKKKTASKKKAPKSKSKEPWEKPAPKKTRHTKLTSKSKASAKAAAKRAGRKYPSLVDNMNAAKKQRAAKSKKKKSS